PPTIDPAYSFSIHWNISNRGTANESFDYSLVLQGPLSRFDPGCLEHAWMGIAYGTSMVRNAEFNVCHMHELPIDGGPGGVRAHEHFSQPKYAPPTHYLGTDYAAFPLNGNYTPLGQLICSFRRLTYPADTNLHQTLNVSSLINMIWAFNPRSGLNSNNDWFTHHGWNHRGAIVAALGEGVMAPRDPVSFTNKCIHGAGMSFVWLVMFPISVYYARYLRNRSGWILVHTFMQSAGTIAITAFLVVILTTVVYLDRPHAKLGLVLVSGVGIQFLLGILNALRLSNESIASVAKTVRLSHNLFGASLLVSSIAQIYLGLDNLNPYSDASVPALWPVFWVIVGTWVAAFAGTEIYFYLQVRRTDSGTGKPTESFAADGGKGMYVAAKGVEVSSEALMTSKAEEERRTFTWRSLQEAIADGELLVVANGRFVYDISKWIRSHPGGQIILHAVAGTDISNDYFHESGFDAGEFTPRPAMPPQDPNRTNASMLRHRSNRSRAYDLAGACEGYPELDGDGLEEDCSVEKDAR
ncbi:hypothetical protein BDK51DRAFT_29139, partial [Blyttiomyces helicus]